MKNTNTVSPRTLFIALDGVDYDLIKELQDEGHFQDFLPAIPFISTFLSDTTVGFTGIMQPLQAGRVPGYEVRFYSFEENRIKGGTPFDIYKIPIKYKYYFDKFRHQMHEKALMYAFPGVAGKQDLVHARDALYESDKPILMTYLGGTDGAAHILGRKRAKKFLIFLDRFVSKMIKDYRTKTGEDLRVVYFSDHGFHHSHLKTITKGTLERELSKKGFHLNDHIGNDSDAVTVPFGLLSGGALFTTKTNREAMARTIAPTQGIDLTFWHDNSKNKVHILKSDGQEAVFEYHGKDSYRYVSIKGDPLGYNALLKGRGQSTGKFLPEKTWKDLSWDAQYPDAGYRLYTAFFTLVENPASILFSTHPDYQFGSLMARMGTWLKFGHKGTHGGLFRETTWGVVMTNRENGHPLPQVLRFDELFDYFLPKVTQYYRDHSKKEVTFILSPEQAHHLSQ